VIYVVHRQSHSQIAQISLATNSIYFAASAYPNPRILSALMSRRKLSPVDNKYTRGVVAVCAGSKKYPGAAILAVGGARRGNAGYVKFLSSNSALISLVISEFPDVVPISSLTKERVDSLVVGPGASTLASIPDLPLVLDGAAIA